MQARQLYIITVVKPARFMCSAKNTVNVQQYTSSAGLNSKGERNKTDTSAGGQQVASSTTLVLPQRFSALKEKFYIFSEKRRAIAGGSSRKESLHHSYWKRIFLVLEEVSHLGELRRAQARVIGVKNQLRDIGDRKRVLLRNLELLRIDLNHAYKDMKYVQNRASANYLELVKKEVELYQKEQELQENLSAADAKEQSLFNEFSEAINDAYEKEKIHTNMLKFLGILGAIVGSLVTMLASIFGLLYNQKNLFSLKQDVEVALTEKVIKKIDELNKIILHRKHEEVAKQCSHESWGSYLHRHTRWIYGWAIPKN